MKRFVLWLSSFIFTPSSCLLMSAMKLQVFFSAIIIVQTKAIVNYQPTKPGCPSAIQPMDNFSLGSFVGVWYEIQKFSSQFGLGTCNSMNVRTVQDGNGSTILIRYTQKLGGNFSDFDQTAPIAGLVNSVWVLQFNRSLNGKLIFLVLDSLTMIH